MWSETSPTDNWISNDNNRYKQTIIMQNLQRLNLTQKTNTNMKATIDMEDNIGMEDNIDMKDNIDMDSVNVRSNMLV